MNWRRIIIIALVVIVIVAGGLFVFQRLSGPEEETVAGTTPGDADTQAIDTGVDTVGAEGTIVPLRDTSLTFPMSGQVAEIFVAEGDLVATGDPLIRLDSTDQEVALQQAQAGLAQAQSNLESAQAGLTAAQTAQKMAELGVDAANARLALVESGPTEEQIAVSELGVSAAEAGIVAAAGNLALVTENPAEARILAAEAQLRAAQAAEKQVRDALNATDDEDEENILEDELIAAVAGVNAAQARLEELRGGATQAERLSASSAVSQAAAQRDATQAQLELLLAGAREEQLEVARVGVQQAEAAQTEAELAVSQAETAVAQAEAGVLQAQATADAAQSALDLMTLTAPFDGVVADITLELGEVASQNRSAVVLADFDGWLVETSDLIEQDVVALAVGFPAQVRVDALPDETLEGTIIEISPVSQIVDGDVTYVVTIQLDDTGDLPLRWGMTTSVEVDTGQS
jgi:HlyD family secretion protein